MKSTQQRYLAWKPPFLEFSSEASEDIQRPRSTILHLYLAPSRGTTSQRSSFWNEGSS